MSDEMSEVERVDKSTSMDSLALPLRDNNESYTFNSCEELNAFIENEKEQWAWLTEVGAPWQDLSGFLKSQIVDPIIRLLSDVSRSWGSNDNEEDFTEKVTQLNNVLKFVSFPFFCRKTGMVINREKDDSKIVAINLLYLCSTPAGGSHSGQMTTFAQHFNKISEIQPNGRVTPLAKAFLDSEAYRLRANRILTKLEIFGLNGGVGELADHLKALSNDVDGVLQKCEESSIELETWKKEKKKEYGDWARCSQTEWNNLGKKMLRKIVSLKAEYLRRSSETLKTSEETVENAKQVYLSQVELDAAVTYWDGKKKEHKESKKWWLIALIGLLLTTAVSPFLIMKFLPVKELADDKLLLSVLNPVTLITSILVISLLSFAIRLCSRQFSTQQHLFLEAEERKTMLKTYLALMKEGKLVEQEDRKIALDALFRPAQTGIIADQGNIVPSDSVVKIIERQASTAKSQ